jgi:hypothetical protein
VESLLHAILSNEIEDCILRIGGAAPGGRWPPGWPAFIIVMRTKLRRRLPLALDLHVPPSRSSSYMVSKNRTMESLVLMA